jgi:alkanesulfonate monooxygenase SsuD/methylene tetrahydromethanopterin reductase-like flavin-dependent oxidoreductase (luciferase family)
VASAAEPSPCDQESMKFALMISGQHGLTYADQVAAATTAEAAGFEAFFRSDHYSSAPGPAGRPATDAWTVLAGIARETRRISIGALVSPVTFRPPGTLAKVVVTVDEMSDGRVEFALGAGWNEQEHLELGLPFPPINIRAEMLEEQLEVIQRLFTEPDGWSVDGRYYSIQKASFQPKPIAAAGRPRTDNGSVRPRVIVGGEGSPRSIRLAVRWADEYNVSGADPAKASQVNALLDKACARSGRAPESLTRSALVPALIAENADALAIRVAGAQEALGIRPGERPDWEAKAHDWWVMGDPGQAIAMIRRYQTAGVQRLILHDYVPRDLDMIRLLGNTVATIVEPN